MTTNDMARAWLAQDPDPQTRAELEDILGRQDAAALTDRFGAKLEFGTAGLRGELGAGPNRMNRVTVMRTAAGLARVLGAGRHVVIGFDARHMSDVFARDTAAVLTGAGLRASVMEGRWPTPVLAFAVRHLGADAGVMVTASHNPPRDNGYKVYWGDGAQIVPPIDREISQAIDAVGRVDELPLGDGWETLDHDAIVGPYLEALLTLPLGEAPRGEARDLVVAYTPLHGVGHGVLTEAFRRAGFATPSVVDRQAEPDPDFPTVSFPNPEEPGAMDLALDLAASIDADLVLANDPDADRCAVGVPFSGGGHRMLTGDEVGGLLAEHVLRNTSGDRLVATTIVSSSLLAKIAAEYGARHTETLTGFKWIMKAGPGLVFGYEEALGYSVGSGSVGSAAIHFSAIGPSTTESSGVPGHGLPVHGLPVHDKDGIGAALTMAGLAAEAKRAGRTLLDLLDDQARRYGLHATSQLSFRVTDLAQITRAMDRLRREPLVELAGRAVESAEDLAEGVAGLPPTDGLRYRLADGARIVVRPSGTEPKLKCYLEIVIPVEESVARARARAAEDLEALKKDLAAALGL